MVPIQAQPESIRLALDEAWKEHQHVRDQTWKALQMVALLAVGLVTVDLQQQNAVASLTAGLLAFIGGVFSACITVHHRNYECQKFRHIMNLQQALKLIHPQLLPLEDIRLPLPLTITVVFSPKVWNSAKFILWMNLLIIAFCALVAVRRFFP